MFKKHRLWILIIVLFHCIQQISSEDDSDKMKREVWSSGSFNLFSSDTNNNKNSENIKTGPMSPFAQVFSAIDSLGLKLNGNVKTSVEFWPPDMDKDKFYKMREEESAFPLTSWFNFKPLTKQTKEPEISYPIIVNDDKSNNNHNNAESTVKQLNKDDNRSLKDYTTKPGVIVSNNYDQKYYKHELFTAKPEVNDQKYYEHGYFTAKPEVAFDNNDQKYFNNEYFTIKPEVVTGNNDDQKYFKSSVKPSYSFTKKAVVVNPTTPDDYSYYSPTEQTINFDDAMTNVGPVIFPRFGLITQKKINDQFITYAPTTVASANVNPRANKKRKLKKKVKTSSITQFNKDKHITQSTPPIDVIAETSSEHTPVNEIIDNNSVQYTDIISNLSNLTELSFSSNNGTGNNHHKFIQESEKSHKNIYHSKVVHSTTPYSFIINVEPEKTAVMHDDVIEDEKLYRGSTYSVTEKLNESSLSPLPPIDMKIKLEPLKNYSSIKLEKNVQKVNDDNDLLKVKVENSSPSFMSTMISKENMNKDENISTTTVFSLTTEKKLHRSRFGIRKFKSKASEAVRISKSPSSIATTTSIVASTTVKSSLPKKNNIKSSIKVLSTSSEKPINDTTVNVKSTARYYTPKSRSRHQNSRTKQITTTKSSSLLTKTSTVKTKIRRTTKKSSTK